MNKLLLASLVSVLYSSPLWAIKNTTHPVSDALLESQRLNLSKNTEGKGFGPQSPRDIDSITGRNQQTFGYAPASTAMNLCNIHFHKNAEHKGGEFTLYAGNGDGKGQNTGYRYSGKLTREEMKAVDPADVVDELVPGDTIEVHYVYSTAKVEPGPTLGACLSEQGVSNPQLRVETQVYVLVNNPASNDFVALTKHGVVNGYHQALNIPSNTGKPIQYLGSTTGPGFNEQGSPFQVTWSVRPKVTKVDIATVYAWLKDNRFKEDHAHGVRNLVINPELLSGQ